MITFTEAAKQKVREYMDQATNGCIGLRVMADRQAPPFRPTPWCSRRDLRQGLELDQGSFSRGGSPAWLLSGNHRRPSSVSREPASTNPQAVVRWDNPVAERLQQVLDDKVAPAVGGHGGWVELLAVEGDTAVIDSAAAGAAACRR
jgi:hypothetical protein